MKYYLFLIILFFSINQLHACDEEPFSSRMDSNSFRQLFTCDEESLSSLTDSNSFRQLCARKTAAETKITSLDKEIKEYEQQIRLLDFKKSLIYNASAKEKTKIASLNGQITHCDSSIEYLNTQRAPKSYVWEQIEAEWLRKDKETATPPILEIRNIRQKSIAAIKFMHSERRLRTVFAPLALYLKQKIEVEAEYNALINLLKQRQEEARRTEAARERRAEAARERAEAAEAARERAEAARAARERAEAARAARESAEAARAARERAEEARRAEAARGRKSRRSKKGRSSKSRKNRSSKKGTCRNANIGRQSARR